MTLNDWNNTYILITFYDLPNTIEIKKVYKPFSTLDFQVSKQRSNFVKILILASFLY